MMVHKTQVNVNGYIFKGYAMRCSDRMIEPHAPAYLDNMLSLRYSYAGIGRLSERVVQASVSLPSETKCRSEDMKCRLPDILRFDKTYGWRERVDPPVSAEFAAFISDLYDARHFAKEEAIQRLRAMDLPYRRRDLSNEQSSMFETITIPSLPGGEKPVYIMRTPMSFPLQLAWVEPISVRLRRGEYHSHGDLRSPQSHQGLGVNLTYWQVMKMLQEQNRMSCKWNWRLPTFLELQELAKAHQRETGAFLPQTGRFLEWTHKEKGARLVVANSEWTDTGWEVSPSSFSEKDWEASDWYSFHGFRLVRQSTKLLDDADDS